MIVLDTNVIFELMAPTQNATVRRWLSGQPLSSVFTTATTQAEILYGIRISPPGKRRKDMEAEALAIFLEDMAGRVLPFDSDAADVYSTIVARRRAVGKPMSQFDAQIAAICRSRSAAIVTRNVLDFGEIDLEIINPWNYNS